MAWVCKDCGYTSGTDKTGDNRCPECGETMEENQEVEADDTEWLGDRDSERTPDLDHTKDLLDQEKK